MTSFFEKLKKGMGIPEEEKPSLKTEKIKEKELALRSGATKGLALSLPKGAKIKEEKKGEIEVKKENLSGGIPQGFPLENLSRQEGELAVDLYQNEEELVIRSAIAGVKPEKLNILIEDDVITISGNREEPEEKGKIDYFTRECYFGPFSRKIISPVEIDSSRAKAIMKEGILLIRIPKIQKEKKIKLEIEKE